MFGLAQRTDNAAVIRDEVAEYLYDVFTSGNTALSGLDRWTQRRVTNENMAKIALVLEADDSVEHCYQNLVREIDTEAETGIYLARPGASWNELRELAREPGVSGRLHKELGKIAPAVFADELTQSHQNIDLLWIAIRARYDRAKIDATISEMIMDQLADGDTGSADMSMALRSLLYSFHEDLARRHSGLPLILNDRSTRELITMVSELSKRGGDYESRVSAICERAGTA